MIKKRGFSKIFFGWWTVLACSFLSFWGFGYHVYGFSALFKPLASELGFSRAVTSVAAAIGRFGGGVEAPVTGWLTDRFGPRWVMLFGVFLFSLSLILMNFINSLWAFYVVWGVIGGIGVNTALSLPLEKAITNWFVKKRGVAISIRWVFSGLLLLPFITWLITTQGWRMACVIGGLVMLFVGLPLIWFFIRQQRPEYYGLLPDGATVEAEAEKDTGGMIDKGVKYAAEIREVEFTLRQAMRTPSYWLLTVAQIGFGSIVISLMIHFIPFLTDMGIDPTKAATTVTIAGLFSIVSRFISGLLADRIKKESLRFLYGVGLLLQAAGISLFLLDQTVAMVYPFLILFYIGQGASVILGSIIRRTIFREKSLRFHPWLYRDVYHASSNSRSYLCRQDI
ncbi:hypothetical protein ES703_78375 [subsurface metagenome]